MNYSNMTQEVEKPPTTTEETKKSPADLPAKGEAEIEHKNSMTIFFILIVIGKINIDVVLLQI